MREIKEDGTGWFFKRLGCVSIQFYGLDAVQLGIYTATSIPCRPQNCQESKGHRISLFGDGRCSMAAMKQFGEQRLGATAE